MKTERERRGEMGAYSACFFFQRAAAAFRALSARSSGVIFAALAAPPFAPPSFPRATAAGFFSRSGSGGGASPMASWKTWKASSLGSRGLRGRLGMSHGSTTRNWLGFLTCL